MFSFSSSLDVSKTPGINQKKTKSREKSAMPQDERKTSLRVLLPLSYDLHLDMFCWIIIYIIWS